MKKNVLLILAVLFVAGSSFAQKKAKQEKKAKSSTRVLAATQSKLESLLESKTFEFVANTVYPLGERARNLGGQNYSVLFSEDQIESILPYFGSVRTAFGSSEGMRFKGKPDKYTIEQKGKKYVVRADVSTSKDTYSIMLRVDKSGFGTLVIDSRNKQTISYKGLINLNK